MSVRRQYKKVKSLYDEVDELANKLLRFCNRHGKRSRNNKQQIKTMEMLEVENGMWSDYLDIRTLTEQFVGKVMSMALRNYVISNRVSDILDELERLLEPICGDRARRDGGGRRMLNRLQENRNEIMKQFRALIRILATICNEVAARLRIASHIAVDRDDEADDESSSDDDDDGIRVDISDDEDEDEDEEEEEQEDESYVPDENDNDEEEDLDENEGSFNEDDDDESASSNSDDDDDDDEQEQEDDSFVVPDDDVEEDHGDENEGSLNENEDEVEKHEHEQEAAEKADHKRKGSFSGDEDKTEQQRKRKCFRD